MTTAVVHGQSDELATMKDGNVLVSVGRMYGRGSRYHSTSWDYNADTLQCFNGSGGLEFFSTVREPPFETTAHSLNQVHLTKDNHLIVIASSSNTSETNLIKLDVSDLGSEYWKEIYNVRVGGGYDLVFYDSCLDHDENIIIVGGRTDPGAGYEKYIWKVNGATGALMWSTGYPDNFCRQVAVDSQNDIYVSCEWDAQYGVGDSAGILQKYSTDGVFQWAWDTGEDGYSGLAVAVSPDDEIFLGM